MASRRGSQNPRRSDALRRHDDRCQAPEAGHPATAVRHHPAAQQHNTVFGFWLLGYAQFHAVFSGFIGGSFTGIALIPKGDLHRSTDFFLNRLHQFASWLRPCWLAPCARQANGRVYRPPYALWYGSEHALGQPQAFQDWLDSQIRYGRRECSWMVVD